MSAGIPPNSLFSALACIGFLLAGLPLPWHIHSWHTGICMYMLWTSFGCLNLFVNSIVWNDNVVNSAPVWCDISARYMVGASVGIPASSLCILRRLYYMTRFRTISLEKGQRRREMIIDILIGFGFPCVVMALQYVVQSNRFLLFEQVGCYFGISNTPAAYFLVFMWPLVIGLINFVYAVLTFRRTLRQKGELKKMLHAGFLISAGHYWRLMALCCVEITLTVPLSIYVIIVNVIGGVGPYVSWAWIHSDFSHVPQFPTDFWQSMPNMAIGVESTRWLYILCALTIFAFFGWLREARDFYRQVFWSLCRRVGYSKPSQPALTVHNGDRRWTTSKHLSIPARAQVRRHSLQTSLSFHAPPRPESISSTSQLNEDEGSIGGPPQLRPLNGLARYTKISWESLIAIPEPALSKDRQPLQDMGQLA